MPPMPAPPSKVLYIRAVPADLSKKLKGAAALQGTSLQEYVVEVLRVHVTEPGTQGPPAEGQVRSAERLA